MGALGLFKPNVKKLKKERDIEGLIKALRYKKDTEVQEAAAWTLGKIGDAKAVEPLIAALRDEDMGVRGYVTLALAKIGEPAVEPLCVALKDKARVVRWEAAVTLGWIKDARAVEPLIAALKDEDLDVRWKVAKVLGEIGDKRAIKPLEELAQNDPDSRVRRKAKDALAKIRGK